MVVPLLRSAAPIAAFTAIARRRADKACTAGGWRQRPKRSGGRRAGGIFFREAKAGKGGPWGFGPGWKTAGGEKGRRHAVVGPDRLPSDRPLEGPGARSFREGRISANKCDRQVRERARSHSDPGPSIEFRNRGTSCAASWRRKAARR